MPTRSHETDLFALARKLAAGVAEERPELMPLTNKLIDHLSPHRHSQDFASVFWFRELYTFSKSQSAVVEILYAAFVRGVPDVKHETLLLAAGTLSDRDDDENDKDKTCKLKDVFRGHPAWGTMIRSVVKGTYRLVPPE